MMVTFRLWWVQVVASPSCMIVQIRILLKNIAKDTWVLDYLNT